MPQAMKADLFAPPTIGGATDMVTSGAIFSECRAWRYALFRSWEFGTGTVNFVGLNPSTADEYSNDPTVTRCINFAKAWGFRAFRMLNLFGYRSTQPGVLYDVRDPIGPRNDEILRRYIVTEPTTTVAAWGTHRIARDRASAVREEFRGRLNVLKLTKEGDPQHPLYLPKTLVPIPWEIAERKRANEEQST